MSTDPMQFQSQSIPPTAELSLATPTEPADLTAPTPPTTATTATQGEVESLTPIGELVHQIHQGLLSPQDLSIYERQACVHHLTHEGFSNDEIATLLHLSVRSVSRLRTQARREQAIKPTAALGDELIGEFQCLTLNSMRRLIRLVNAPDSPAYVKLWAEDSISRQYHRYISTVFKLRYCRTGDARLSEEERKQRASTPDLELSSIQLRMKAMGL